MSQRSTHDVCLTSASITHHITSSHHHSTHTIAQRAVWSHMKNHRSFFFVLGATTNNDHRPSGRSALLWALSFERHGHGPSPLPSVPPAHHATIVPQGQPPRNPPIGGYAPAASVRRAPGPGRKARSAGGAAGAIVMSFSHERHASMV